MKIIIIYFSLFFSILQARELGQTEITTEEGIEVYQKEKYYLYISMKYNIKNLVLLLHYITRSTGEASLIS